MSQNLRVKKPAAIAVANGLDITKQCSCKLEYSKESELPPYPSVKKMGELYISLDLEWTGVVIIFSDAAQLLDVPIATKQTIVLEDLDAGIDPNEFSWSIAENKYVDVYTAGISGSLEQSLVTQLLFYGALDISLYQIEFGEILSPLFYSAKEPMRVVAA